MFNSAVERSAPKIFFVGADIEVGTVVLARENGLINVFGAIALNVLTEIQTWVLLIGEGDLAVSDHNLP